MPTLTNGKYVIQAVVDSLVESGTGIDTVTFSRIIAYQYDEQLTVDEMPPVDCLESLQATVLSKFTEYLPLDVTGEAELFLIDVGFNNTKLLSVSNVQESYGELVTLFTQFQQGIEEGSTSLRDISLKIGKLIKRINSQYKYPMIPTHLGLNALVSAVTEIDNQWQSLVKANPEAIKTKKTSISSIDDSDLKARILEFTDTDRSGLRDLYVNHMRDRGDTPLHVILTCAIESNEISPSGMGRQVVMSDVEIRLYDPNVPYDKSPVIDHVDHLNSFYDNDESLYPVGTKGTFLGRVISYQRGSASIDVGVSLLQWAPIDKWMNQWSEALGTWSDHLQTHGLVGSASLHKKLKAARSLLMSEHLVTVNTQQVLWSDVQHQVSELEVEYQSAKEVVAKLQEEADKESKLWNRLHDLNLEAIAFLTGGQ